MFSAYETIYGDDELELETTTVGVGVYYFESTEQDIDFVDVR